MRRSKRECGGFGLSIMAVLGSNDLINYKHIKMDKEKIGYWQELVRQRDAGYRRSRANVEAGDHVACYFMDRSEGCQWSSWVEIECGDTWAEVAMWFWDMLDNG